MDNLIALAELRSHIELELLISIHSQSRRGIIKSLLVSSEKGGTCQRSLSNCDTLAISFQNSSCEVFSYLGMDGVANSIYGHDDVLDVLAIPLFYQRVRIT